MKKLLVLAGAGDPISDMYLPVYRLIEFEAKKRENEVIILSYPGHVSVSNYDCDLEVNSSLKVLNHEIVKLERQKLKYNIFCRSYGCFVIMSYLLKNDLKYVDRIVLWGPSPSIVVYDTTVFDQECILNAKKNKGSNLSLKTFNSIEPFEISLLKYNKANKIIIATGSEDKHCKREYFNFLRAYIKNDLIKFKIIKGISHEVVEYNEEYIKMIFGK
jgi:hypothetical protein